MACVCYLVGMHHRRRAPGANSARSTCRRVTSDTSAVVRSRVPILAACLIAAASPGVSPAHAQAEFNPTTVAPPSGRPGPRDLESPAPFTNPNATAPTITPRLLPVFFPAPPPILEDELPAAPAVRDPIWTELAPFTNEIFYAPLSTRLSSGELSRRLRPRLDAYRAKRDEALAALRIALAAPDRTDALARLAATQAATLDELATTADELRRELPRGSFLVAEADWNAHRNWRLGNPKSKRSPQEALYDEFSVLRAALYYQPGLSLAQRQLLREIVIETGEALGDRPAATANAFEPEEIVFFLPHGSRLRLPAPLPPELSADLAAFTAAKTALRRELRAALVELDRAGDSKRERQLQELAARQAPQFAALEPLAERIRVALAALPASTAATPPGVPPELARRIDAYLRAKAEVQSAARGTRAGLADFEQSNRARLAELAAEARAIRDEVARLSAAAPPGSAPKTVDGLLADFTASFQRQQRLALYRDYRTAVLAPGLAPAQRQLLFDAALAALDQPGVKDWQAVPE